MVINRWMMDNDGQEWLRMKHQFVRTIVQQHGEPVLWRWRPSARQAPRPACRHGATPRSSDEDPLAIPITGQFPPNNWTTLCVVVHVGRHQDVTSMSRMYHLGASSNWPQIWWVYYIKLIIFRETTWNHHFKNHLAAHSHRQTSHQPQLGAQLRPILLVLAFEHIPNWFNSHDWTQPTMWAGFQTTTTTTAQI